MPRRANGEGSIRKLKSGYWEARIMTGVRADGKPQIKTFTAKKRAIVAKRLADFIAGIKTAAPSCRETVGEWMDAWLDRYVASRLKTSTRVSYENIVKNQIIPRLGPIRLSALNRKTVEEFYASLQHDGRADGKGGLSAKTIQNVHIVLHKALEEAVLSEIIVKNPSTSAALPKSTGSLRLKAEALTLEEQRALTALCGGDVYGTAVFTALSTGLRIGELLGLRWPDIDFCARTIRVVRQLIRLKDFAPNAVSRTRLRLEESTKTGTSARVIPMGEDLYVRLFGYRERCESDPVPPGFRRKGRLPARDDGRVPPDMVFAGHGGGFLDPATFRYHYRRLLDRADARRATVHALRHTFATRALEAGVPVKAVSQILGHAGSRVTMDIYSHILPAFQAEAMKRIASYVSYSCPDNSTIPSAASAR